MAHCSGYFCAAFTGSFKEAEEKELHLKDVTWETFDAFVDWLYLRNLPVQKSSSNQPSDTGRDGAEHESFLNAHEITELHIFADRYDIPDLRRYTIDMMFAYFKNVGKTPAAKTIEMAFESLPDTSLLRKLLVHRYCESTWKVTPEDELLWTHEILHAVLVRYRDVIRDLDYSCDLDLCDYHDHANEEEKDECQKKRRAQEWYA